jgi:hypothetical protein
MKIHPKPDNICSYFETGRFFSWSSGCVAAAVTVRYGGGVALAVVVAVRAATAGRGVQGRVVMHEFYVKEEKRFEKINFRQ